MDRKVQVYLRKIREGVNVAAATGILLKYGCTKLAEYRGPVLLNKHCPRLLLNRMGFVERKATTATSKYTEVNFKGDEGKFSARCCLNHCYGRHPSRTNHELGPHRKKDGPMYTMDNGKAGHKACGANRGEQ